jgi:hypothetical protein
METRPKGIGKMDSPQFLFTEEFRLGKGSQEAFRRVSPGKDRNPEKEKPYPKWNSKRAHRVHPYWSDNLKYGY